MFIKKKCKKCGRAENIAVYVKGRSEKHPETMDNTFYCEDCGDLSTIDTLNEKMVCKHCKSKNITSDLKKYKCKKCGGNDFENIIMAET